MAGVVAGILVMILFKLARIVNPTFHKWVVLTSTAFVVAWLIFEAWQHSPFRG